MVLYKKIGRGQHEQMYNNDEVRLAYSLTIMRWNNNAVELLSWNYNIPRITHMSIGVAPVCQPGHTRVNRRLDMQTRQQVNIGPVDQTSDPTWP